MKKKLYIYISYMVRFDKRRDLFIKRSREKEKKKSIINKVVSLVLLEKEITREREKEREDGCVCSIGFCVHTIH